MSARRGDFGPGLPSLLEPGAHWKHRVVTAAAKLDLFTILADGPQSAEGVAGHYRGDPRAFEIFLNALTGLRLLVKSGGRYRNSRFTRRRLVRGAADYQGDQLVVDAMFWGLWDKLEEVLITGRSPLEPPVFEGQPEAAERLILGLHHDALLIASEVAGLLPLDSCRTLLDLGGGAGTYAMAFCHRNRSLRATILDLPNVTRVARPIVAASDVADRVTILDGDFRAETIPGSYDAVFMSNVLHGGGPEENLELLGRAAGCLDPGGLLIIRDVVMDDALTDPAFGAVFAVNMLLHTSHGRCYASSEIASWLETAGLMDLREIDSHAVIIAQKPQ